MENAGIGPQFSADVGASKSKSRRNQSTSTKGVDYPLRQDVGGVSIAADPAAYPKTVKNEPLSRAI